MSNTAVSNGGQVQALSAGGSIDETAISYGSVTSASLNPASDVLTVFSGAGPAATVQLSGNLQGASLGLSSDGGGGTQIVDLGASPQVNDPVSPATTEQQTVILAGSHLQFVNTYTSKVGQGYEDAIVTAENFYQSQIASTATLDFTFDTAPGVGLGANSYTPVDVTFSQLETALSNAATSADDRAAVSASSALAGQFAGATFQVPDPLAQLLGLPGASTTSDTTQLDSTLSYFYNQASPIPGAYDAVAVLEHEISEGGLGRVGGDGSSNGILDLFRHAAAGQPDSSLGRNGNPAYFSIDGTHLLTQFHNPISPNGHNDGGDSGDWDASGTGQTPTYIPGQSNAYDAFGVAPSGAIGLVTPTDLRVLDVIGWTLTSNAKAPAAADDFNGDGLSDIVWRNTNGDAGIWLTTSSGGFTPVDFGVIDPNWTIQTVGDFNGDGKADILWRNANGAVGEWLSQPGSGYTGFTMPILANVDPSWQIEGVGDFTGNGLSDILWRNTNSDAGIWLTTAGGGYTPVDFGVIDANWTIQAVGDFNGDGKADILWRNNSTGQVGEWLSNGGSGYTGFTMPILAAVDPSWKIQGVGDFDGNGLSDVLWRNTNGDTGLWLTTAGGGWTVVDFGVIDLNWKIQGGGDFNGDGKADILWRNSATGQVGEWLSNPGSGYAGFTMPILATVDPSWQIQGTPPALQGAGAVSAAPLAHAMASMGRGSSSASVAAAATASAALSLVINPGPALARLSGLP